MAAKDIYAALIEKFGEDVELSAEELAGDPFVCVKPERLHDVLECLKSEPRFAMNQLTLITGVDYGDRIEAVYHLYSYTHNHMAVVKALLDHDAPEVDTAIDLWGAAEWHERETYDMLGIQFRGHPNLRRILLPDDWEGFPLRLDYKQPEEYHGIKNDLHTDFFAE